MQQLHSFPLIVPGSRGLNTQAKGALLGPEWATRLENTVLDSNGRVAARKGWESVTTTAFDDAFVSGIEYRKKDGTVHMFATAEKTAAASTDAGVTWSDVTGTASFTSGHWHLVNFNDNIVGFQAEEKPLVYNGTSCSQVSDSSAPTGGVGTAAFGRVWCVDSDGVTLQYSALLDHTDWSGTGSGSIDFSNIWPDNDTIKAVAAYNNVLVVFGTKNIIILEDGSGSEIGLDPTAAVVADTIPGIGCLAQSSIQLVNGDLWFLSNSRELMSLQRVVLEQKSGNVSTLSRNVSDLLRDSIDSGSFSMTRLRSAFSAKHRMYLLSLPVESSSGAGDEAGKVFAFDTRGFMEDGTARCIGIWNQMVPTVFWSLTAGDLYMALETVEGKVGKYNKNKDNGNSYTVIYESGWMDITGQGLGRLLMLKRITGRFLLDVQTSVVLKWAFDFQTTNRKHTLTLKSAGLKAEWGVSEWGVAEWGGGVDLNDQRVSAGGAGQYMKVGVEATINGGVFSIQQLDLLAKVGRMQG